MLVIKAFVNYNQIDEIHVRNMSQKENGKTLYTIVEPKGDYPIIKHKREDGWMNLMKKVITAIEREKR